MRVLVVGGAGYVGGPLCDELIKQGHEVKIIDLLLYENSFFKNISLIRENILDWASIKKYVYWSDAVIWLAALVGDPACSINPDLTYHINTESIKPLLNDFKGRLIFPSTCSVYGAQAGLLTEDSELNPLSIYAKSKILAERLILDSNTDHCIFRLGTLFGVGDSHTRIRLDLVVNLLTVKAKLVKKMSVFGGEQFRPLLHVKDVGKVFTKSIESNISGIFNIHYDNYTILDIAKIINKIIPESEIELTESNFQDSRNYSVSSQKLFNKLNIKAEKTVESGVIEISQIIEENRISDLFDPRFSNWQTLRRAISVIDNELISISSKIKLL